MTGSTRAALNSTHATAPSAKCSWAVYGVVKIPKEGRLPGVLRRLDIVQCCNVVFVGWVFVTRSSLADTFCSTSDDGSFVFVDGSRIVDNDGLHGPRRR